MADKITVEIDLETNKAEIKAREFSKQAKKAGKEAGESIEKFVSEAPRKAFALLSKEVIALGAIIATGLFSKQAIAASLEQTHQVNQLSQALANAGLFSKGAAERLIEYAEALQIATGVSKDQTIAVEKLALIYAKSIPQTEKLTAAALDLAAATGANVTDAVTALGKTLNGNLGLLQRMLPGLKGFTAEQLKAGAALEFVAERFKNAAAQGTTPFESALARVSLAFNKVQEAIGDLITKNPEIIQFINDIGKKFDELATKVNGNATTIGNFISDAFGRIQGDKVVALDDKIKQLQSTLEKAGEFRGGALMTAADWVGKKLGLPGAEAADKEITGLVNQINSLMEERAKLLADRAKESGGKVGAAFVEGIGNTPLQGIPNFMEQITDATRITLDEIKNNLFPSFTVKTAEDLKKFVETAKAELTNLTGTIRNTFIAGFGNAFAAFGNALATGGNGLKEFGKSMLNTLGQLCMQLGQFFILVGAGMTATGTLLGLSGAAAIAAGIALNVFGGALQGMAGGSGGAAAVTAPAGGGVSQPGMGPELPEVEMPEEQAAKPQTSVTLVVQGNILDRRETGLELAEVLRETFQTNDIVFA